METIEFRAMGSRMLAALDAPPSQAAILAQVPAWFEAWEVCLSRFRADSELSLLNQRGCAPTPVSEVLWAVLEAACQGADASGGLVVPTLLDALAAAGYDRSFEAIAAALPAGTALLPAPPPAAAAPAWRAIQRDAGSHTVRLPVGMHLDFGGIAKGWAADQAARRLSEFGPALVDAGGDIALSGPLADGSRWPIGIANPLAADQQLRLLGLAQACVATSGRDHHRWQRGGVWQHHILDPRTGQPAQTEILTATLIAPSACQAEVAAKTVLILGQRAGLDWLEARPWLAGLLVLADGQVLTSRRLPAYLWS